MTQQEKKDTKNKILEVAQELFSQFGYNGTSVRQIAEKSGTNIAAINYHFNSKANLYWSVVDDAYEWIEKGFKEICQNANSLDEVVRSLFVYLREGEQFVSSTMRIFLSGSAPAPEKGHNIVQKLEGEYFGPPGGLAIVEFLKREYGDKIKQKNLEWVVKCLFASLFHFATMCATSTLSEIKKDRMSDKEIEEALVKMAKALIQYSLPTTG